MTGRDNTSGHGKGAKEIFLPWKNFNNNSSRLYLGTIPKELEDIAKEVYPHWDKVGNGVKEFTPGMYNKSLENMLMTLPTL